MKEGDNYPELRRAHYEPAELRESRFSPRYWQNPDPRRVGEFMEDHRIPAIRITMPQEDWAAMLAIYQAHYSAANRNPAVQDLWHQYRMMVALTTRAEK